MNNSFKTVPKKYTEKFKALKFDREIKIMEVCGTHTVAIHRFGIQNLLPDKVKLVSGPGCPVCVTPDSYIDEAIYLAGKGYTITTFGDMIKVPGNHSSLEKERGNGANIKIVYSAMDALNLARKSDKQVVFLSVGFETTTPGIAVTLLEAAAEKRGNFSLLTANRIVPPALSALASEGFNINGFLLPGHVSAIIGKKGYAFLEQLKIPGVISGFEPLDIVMSMDILFNLIKENRSDTVNNYKRVVRDDGNPISVEVVNKVFEVTDSEWRGIGIIPDSGLKIRPAYAEYDIRNKVKIPVESSGVNPDCRCGEVLKGQIDPPKCPLFGNGCTPHHPIGPCMVSAEGSCGAWYHYG